MFEIKTPQCKKKKKKKNKHDYAAANNTRVHSVPHKKNNAPEPEQEEIALAERVEKRVSAYASLGVISALIFGFTATVLLSDDLYQGDEDQPVYVVLFLISFTMTGYATIAMTLQFYYATRLLAEDPGGDMGENFLNETRCMRWTGDNMLALGVFFFISGLLVSVSARLGGQISGVIRVLGSFIIVATAVVLLLTARNYYKKKTSAAAKAGGGGGGDALVIKELDELKKLKDITNILRV